MLEVEPVLEPRSPLVGSWYPLLKRHQRLIFSHYGVHKIDNLTSRHTFQLPTYSDRIVSLLWP